MNKISALIILSISLTVAASGCECIGEGNADCAAVFAAEEEVIVDGRAFYLGADLWVNLMPPVSPEGPDLNVVVKITARDGDDFPDDYTADYVWLLQGDTIVVLEYVEEKPRELSGNNVLEKVANTKSKLNPDLPVDVVARIIDANGDKYYLRASDKIILVTH